MNTLGSSKLLLLAWALATAPMVSFFIVKGRLRLAVIALAFAIAGLVLGSRTVKWAVVGAMAGATIGSVTGWWVIGLGDNVNDEAVLAVLLGGIGGAMIGTAIGGKLAERTRDVR